jgi:hypothetical protein
MDIHTDTLAIVRNFICSFYNQQNQHPSIENILDALMHPEMEPYWKHFEELVAGLCPTYPISYTPQGWLAIEVVHDPRCYHCIPLNPTSAP